MTYKIKEIVKASSSSEFQNDVQLSEYRGEHNSKLLKGYIFTKKAVAGKKSSIDLLKLLCEAYTPGRNPNRFVFIATYGHGKSHFALSLANYFGKPFKSPEIKTVLDKIEHAVNDSALYGYFKDFKHSKKPCLVLVMSGIDQRDLSTQFYNAIEVALKCDNIQEPSNMPFWYKGAERYIESVNQGGDKEKANKILANSGLDLDLLLDRVKKQDSSTSDICHNLCFELNGITPNFGAAVNLKEAVTWISENLCGNEYPYSGLLILFDEFSAFIRDYGLSMNSRPGTPLQDLLDGVDSCKEKVAFVAFSQHTPDSVARSVLHGGTNLQSLTIQLNRLPSQQQYHLHSCLEEVLDAYLRQDSDNWTKLCADPHFSNELFEANDVAVEVFKSRYESELGWRSEHFQDVVTKGCFPLHPMTTALLASVKFQETTNPRSVLGFVLKSIDEVKDQPAIINNRPAWIHSTMLVEHFREMLGSELWKDYIDAKFQAGGADALDDEISILKGMMLQKAAEVSTPRQFGFDRVVGEFAGVSGKAATAALQQLAGAGVIRHDSVRNLYMFWPAGRGANKVEDLLKAKLASIQGLNRELITKVESTLRESSLISVKQISVSWGHRDDWQAEEILASREMLTTDSLRKIVSDRLRQSLVADDTKVRGLVVWLVANEDDDVRWFREELPILLGQEFPDSTIPIIFKRPRSYNAVLPSLLCRTYALTKFSTPERQEVGGEQYEAVVTQNKINLKDAVEILRGSSDSETLPAFRARIQAVQPRTLEVLLEEVYKMAYSKNHHKWFNQYKINQTHLKSATKLLIGHLLNSTLDVPQALSTSKIAKEAVDLFLKAEWKLVDSSYRVKEPPETSKICPGWQELENYFSVQSGQKNLKIVIEKLLNAPFGYDYNTVSILFAAWCGFNRHELEMFESNKPKTIANMKTDVKDFIKNMADLYIKRRNPDELKGKVNDILKVLQSGRYDIDGANAAITTLNEYIVSNTVEDKQTAIDARNSLQVALDKALNYDQMVNAIYSKIERSGSFSDLFNSLNSLQQVSFSSKVMPSNCGISDVRNDILRRIEAALISKCDLLHKITSIADYGLRLKQLTDLKLQLNRHDLTNLTTKIDSAIEKLNFCKQQIESQDKDKESLAYLSGLATTGTLVTLRSSLEKLSNIKFCSDSANIKAEDKIKVISKEIDRISSLLLSIYNKFEKATNSKEIQTIQNSLHAIHPLLEGSEECTLSTLLIGRCEKLTDFFELLSDIQRNEPRTPSQVESVILKLSELQNSYESLFGSELTKIVPNEISRLESFASEKQKDALKWLDTQEHELNINHKPDSVLDALKNQPKFIPASAVPRIKALQLAAQQMMDEDQVLHVVSIFNKITDLNKKQECLKQLQALLKK